MRILLMIVGAVLLYGTSMIVVRLRMTELAYEFERLKNEERALREEQVRLRARLAEKLSPMRLKLDGFTEPSPEQVVKIP